VPGWGGCYLLPNLHRPPKALKVIIENPTVAEPDAEGRRPRAGIADAMFEPADFLEESLRWAAEGRQRRGHRGPPGDRP
jgi:enoyl-CoA hydratase/carnithine racemase